MAKGVNARYMMPAFIPLAGFSPNCWVVLVQTEHCATELVAYNTGAVIRSAINIHFFISLFVIQRYKGMFSRTNGPTACYYEKKKEKSITILILKSPFKLLIQNGNQVTARLLPGGHRQSCLISLRPLHSLRLCVKFFYTAADSIFFCTFFLSSSFRITFLIRI